MGACYPKGGTPPFFDKISTQELIQLKHVEELSLASSESSYTMFYVDFSTSYSQSGILYPTAQHSTFCAVLCAVLYLKTEF